MPKLNLIGMIVLSVAIAAGAAVMAMRTSNVRTPAPQLGRLIRLLGDTDPDLRREAEQELKALGARAEPALKEAAGGSDPVVADRARTILGIKTPIAPRDVTPVVVADVDPAAGRVRLILQVASSPRRPDEPVIYYLRLHNGSKRSVVVARDATFGQFERVDSEGRVAVLAVEAPEPGDALDLVTVAPGESVELSPASGLLRVRASGTYRLRYVYDAAPGSEYRKSVAKGHLAGSALESERFVSNTVSVTIP